MTATAVRVTTAALKTWRCRYCQSGHCGSCPGAVWVPNPKTGNTDLWRCNCGKNHRPPYCTECKNEHPDDVNQEIWRCYDYPGCASRVAVRRQNSELWQTLQRCKSVAANRARAKRLQAEHLLAQVDPAADEDIERLHDQLEELEKEQKRKARAARTPKPKKTVGNCECCGQTTRGGRFLPGHDAKMKSRLKYAWVMNKDEEARAELVRRGWA